MWPRRIPRPREQALGQHVLSRDATLLLGTTRVRGQHALVAIDTATGDER